MVKQMKRGRKKLFGPQCAVRLPEEMAGLVDAEVRRRQGERPGQTVTRADVIRGCIHKALAKRR